MPPVPSDYPPLDPALLPVPATFYDGTPRPKCGNRTDLPKAKRVHWWRYAGVCWRTNPNIPGIKWEMDIAICVRCGVEKRRTLGPVDNTPERPLMSYPWIALLR